MKFLPKTTGLVLLAPALMVSAAEVSRQPMIEVVAPLPLHAPGLYRDQLTTPVQTVSAESLKQGQALSMAEHLRLNLSSVTINEAQNNPWQPDIRFRGFTASPLLGLPQGLSVYVEGIRFNEPFGDTVNWDLLPDDAIASINLFPGSNPVFGQNTLGGALSLQLKNGFTHEGSELEVMLGENGLRSTRLSSGGSKGNFAWYLTGNYLEEDGWRQHSPSELRQGLANLSWMHDSGRINLLLAANDNQLLGNGAAPRTLLERFGRDQVFTHPDQTETRMNLLALNGDTWLDDELQLAGNIYYRRNRIDTFNGDDTEYEACEQAANLGLLCEEPGADEEVVELIGGGNASATLPSGEEPSATNNTSATDTTGLGTALQLTFTRDLFGRPNQLSGGVSVDYARTDFKSDTELAELTEDRGTQGSGLLVDESRVRLRSQVEHYGLYVSDTIDLSDRLSATLAGRYNYTSIQMRDGYGTELDGDHRFSRFNPAAGLRYRINPELNLYANYSEASRAPPPVELSCADPDAPCKLPNAFLSDPPLAQVVAKTWELGLRGQHSATEWRAGVFRSVNHDDILFINGGNLSSEGYFDNVGKTRRQGVELALSTSIDQLRLAASYTWLDATFQTPFIANSPNNPAANADGQIPVEKGDRLPGLPEHMIKLSADWSATQALSLGADLVWESDRVFRGDEANLNETVDGYTLVNLRGLYRVNPDLEFFLRVDNVFDREYETFGLYGESDEVLEDEGIDDPYFVGPGKPRTGRIGMRLRF
ncbi:TonB-dependent receptor [Marinobacterium sediminicola]|uniref:Outer membrane receptor proteins, mostly Fe transport n=1 Tax=Marinobacterium sediminicola TaxID=518898 RepID=A0ABY1S242_9GAMM|nr:TonB-dependent receptor [Marinobacterium sediminicola]ULG69414.1 TonB-dependent receptor [Marinobacterium sediminicola]SMR75564.1 Outer membrane receptor proteins, mostly Fe transport [Marinobacterium sediminicola]